MTSYYGMWVDCQALLGGKASQIVPLGSCWMTYITQSKMKVFSAARLTSDGLWNPSSLSLSMPLDPLPNYLHGL